MQQPFKEGNTKIKSWQKQKKRQKDNMNQENHDVITVISNDLLSKIYK
jgi:hypothetical protein